MYFSHFHIYYNGELKFYNYNGEFQEITYNKCDIGDYQILQYDES